MLRVLVTSLLFLVPGFQTLGLYQEDENSFQQIIAENGDPDSVYVDADIQTIDYALSMDFKTLNETPTNTMLNFDQGPPPFSEHARMARYIVHNSEWCSMATISTRIPIQGAPFANVFSVSDGTSVKDSSGIPYFYLSSMEMSVEDLEVNNNASITMSLAQGNFCDKKKFDPEDPRCAHVILNGKVVKLERDSEEGKFAQNSLFKRHPEMSEWPQDHNWSFRKLDINNILILDFFGGPHLVLIENYLKATPF